MELIVRVYTYDAADGLFALFRPDRAQKCDIGCTRAFVGAAPIFFALQALHSARFALFCGKQGAFMWVYVAVSRSDFYVFLRGSPYRLEPRAYRPRVRRRLIMGRCLGIFAGSR